MAPAPKSRIPKGEVVELGDKYLDGDVNPIEVGDDVKAQHKTVRRIAMSDGDLPQPQENGIQRERESSSRTASNLRRPSSITTGSDQKGLLKRSSTAEMREHLKYLGPSNLASRPRQTRYNTVKIKPGAGAGAGAQPENPLKRQELAPESKVSSVSKAQGVPGEVISSAGKEAKDGVQAVQTGYGTISASPKISGKPTNSPPFDRRKSSASPPRSPDEGIQTPTDRKTGSSRANSQSTLGSLKNGGTSQPPSPKYKKSLTVSVARSGSITENIVEAGGIKKTVLEMSSSSESQGDEQGASGNSPVEREEREGREQQPADEERTQKAGGENSSGRKKRRRRRRKGGNDGLVEGGENEGTPLLEGRIDE